MDDAASSQSLTLHTCSSRSLFVRCFLYHTFFFIFCLFSFPLLLVLLSGHFELLSSSNQALCMFLYLTCAVISAMPCLFSLDVLVCSLFILVACSCVSGEFYKPGKTHSVYSMRLRDTSLNQVLLLTREACFWLSVVLYQTRFRHIDNVKIR